MKVSQPCVVNTNCHDRSDSPLAFEFPGVKPFIIAAAHSGSGKTTISIGIMAALRNRGLRVQPFKVGPDYIDPAFHYQASGNPSYNLDTWMMGSDGVKKTFFHHSHDAHVAVIEGVMGFFDGKGGSSIHVPGLYEGSTAHCAFILNLPVILVIDARAMAHSAGALVYGFTHYVKELKFAGIIFNKVAGEKHYSMLKEAVQARSPVPVLGYLLRHSDIAIPERHLGLDRPQEQSQNEQHLADRIGQMIEHHVDLTALVSHIPPLSLKSTIKVQNSKSLKIRLAVAFDRAFWFYYEENFDILREQGAEIIFFSPLSDKKLPSSLDALYLGGGYPELYAERLSSNRSLLASIKDFADQGGCIYAECGGFMLLTEQLTDLNNNSYEMAAVFKTHTKMREKRHHLGYREVKLKNDTIFGKKGSVLRGHEFHYSDIEYPPQNAQEIYTTDTSTQVYRFKNTFASYIHIHFASNSDTGMSFVDFVCNSLRDK